jgi:hypothetical protein
MSKMDTAVLHEHPLGLTWTIEEPMERSSHALNDDGRVWLVDPVDNKVAIERAQNLGEISGVIQLLDRHNRDSAALAKRFGVPIHVNNASIPDAPFEVVPVVGAKRWNETALWWEEKQALVVAEAIGTSKMYTGGHDAGVHLVLRFFPPKKKLGEFEPEHLLVGHGPPIHGAAAAAALQGALERSRRNFPRTLVGAFRNG